MKKPKRSWEDIFSQLERREKGKREPPVPAQSSPEESSMAQLKANRLPRVVHWRSHTGKWVVVTGPFPDQMYRSETRDTVLKAAKLLVEHCFNRPATTRDDQFAKVLATDIIEIDSGENEFGLVTP